MKHISTNNLPLVFPTVHYPMPYNNFGISSIPKDGLKRKKYIILSILTKATKLVQIKPLLLTGNVFQINK
jgi:hypothetical protein